MKHLGADGGASLERPPMASASFAVVTAKPDDVVTKLAEPSEIMKRLTPRHCGDACDAVRKTIESEDDFEVDIGKTDELMLPPSDMMDTVASGLTPAEREDLKKRPTSVVVRTHGAFAKEQVAARTAFAVTAVLAEALDGYVYDEASRRIETASEFSAHAVTAPLGKPAFERRHIAVQLYRQEDGTARLLTLGMARFGSPDLSMRGASMGSGPLLAEVLNAVASKLAFDLTEPAVTITLDDVARVVGKKPSELNPTPSAAKPVMLTLVDAEHADGDPDNEVAEVLPWGGSTRENWDSVVTSLFGALPSMKPSVDDPELAEIAKKAQKSLPGAIKRLEAGDGELYVKGPFAVPEEARVDGGNTTELLWLLATSCDARACTGTLANEPSYATNLAPGKTSGLPRTDVTDWMLRQHDGGVAGGDSLKTPKARGK
jgi:uncharacterized protein YegJ (DUF2314 family)